MTPNTINDGTLILDRSEIENEAEQAAAFESVRATLGNIDPVNVESFVIVVRSREGLSILPGYPQDQLGATGGTHAEIMDILNNIYESSMELYHGDVMGHDDHAGIEAAFGLNNAKDEADADHQALVDFMLNGNANSDLGSWLADSTLKPDADPAFLSKLSNDIMAVFSAHALGAPAHILAHGAVDILERGRTVGASYSNKVNELIARVRNHNERPGQ